MQPTLIGDLWSPPFDGSTFDAAQDRDRLARQLSAVREFMLRQEWCSLVELASGCGYSVAAVASRSARLRDLRKNQFGAYSVERRRRAGVAGVWEYRVRASACREAA